jgi:hypothetical protein
VLVWVSLTSERKDLTLNSHLDMWSHNSAALFILLSFQVWRHGFRVGLLPKTWLWWIISLHKTWKQVVYNELVIIQNMETSFARHALSFCLSTYSKRCFLTSKRGEGDRRRAWCSNFSALLPGSVLIPEVGHFNLFIMFNLPLPHLSILPQPRKNLQANLTTYTLPSIYLPSASCL